MQYCVIFVSTDPIIPATKAVQYKKGPYFNYIQIDSEWVFMSFPLFEKLSRYLS